ncbi:hypothetical protein A3E46_01465 [Candidatus Woesebacteria bacterium RIFCSPHIGHO2_12_FULL_46_16]|uniref:Peptidase M16 n=1 Tax=Candidatus Woesebacteria bacterium RIFCSPHIGHO2_12_FULL_46_16 TaxID=1802513 RepID=A0A1F8AWK1_9BACT|nr:MAG: hypothetical protein A3E46_01465 [Candidatus Woesebacteria bacterium RIFCSPHIGHO2_12_FULL_46_16]
MDYKRFTLKNGLKVVVSPMPNLESATLTVWVKTGSRFEDARTNGISHFLEHMVFKGSKKRPTAKEIAEVVDSIGAETNAGTSKDWTNFYIKAHAGHLEKAFDVLSDMILNPILKEEEIEREKGVIIEELAMYEDTPMIRIGDIFEQLIFDKTPLGRDIGGTPNTVKNIMQDDFIRYRKRYYYAENMLLTVAGKVKRNKVVRLAEKYFGELKKGGLEGKETKIKGGQKGSQLKLHSKKKEQAHFILGFRGNPRGYKGRFAEAILSVILGGGMSSRLFTEVRERRGLAYAVKTETQRYQDTGYMGTYAGVDVVRVDEAIKVVLDQHYGLADGRYPISSPELTKAKEYLKGHMALALEDTKGVNEFFGESELFLKKIETPEEVFKAVDKVTIEDVLFEAKKLFVPKKLNLAIIGPYENSERFEKLIK